MAMFCQKNFQLICQGCESRECLHAPWVPESTLEEREEIWSEECCTNCDSRPTPQEKVEYLRAIKPKQMIAFFKTHCLAR